MLVDQELMGVGELAVNELLVCSQPSDCGRCGTEDKVSLTLLLGMLSTGDPFSYR